MKIRKFYPRQVIRKLQGEHTTLSAAQTAVLRYAMLRSRKLGYAIQSASIASATDLAGAINSEAAQAILSNRSTRIILRPSI